MQNKIEEQGGKKEKKNKHRRKMKGSKWKPLGKEKRESGKRKKKKDNYRGA